MVQRAFVLVHGAWHGAWCWRRVEGYASPSFDAALAKVRDMPTWSVFEMACGHDIMVDMPERLAEILLHST